MGSGGEQCQSFPSCPGTIAVVLLGCHAIRADRSMLIKVDGQQQAFRIP